jgi:hypothetical protein
MDSDLSLKEIYHQEWMTVRAYNVCVNNDIETLSQLLNAYKQSGSFVQFRNCGTKTEKELIGICKKYLNHDNINDDTKEPNENTSDLSLKEINEREWMTVRAYNVCVDNGIEFLSQLLRVYSQPKSFSQFRNCGIKTEEELIEICKKYLHFNIEEEKPKEIIDISIEVINQLTLFKKNVLYRYLLNIFDNLSVRARNGLLPIVDGEATGHAILNNVVLKKIDFLEAKNIGKYTLADLETFKSNAIHFIDKLNKIDDTLLTQEYLKLICDSYYSESGKLIGEHINIFINEVNKIKIFTLFNFLNEHDYLFKPNSKEVFKYVYCIPFESRLTMEAIANKMIITRERVRQIKIKLIEEIKDNVSFILSLRPEDLSNYGFSEDMDMMIINESFANKLNETENVSYNYLFYSLVFSELFKRTHSAIGFDDTIAKNKQTKRNVIFRNSYLITLPIFESLNFDSFIQDVFDKLTDRITETYSIYFEGYLKDFVSSQERQLFTRTKNVCEQILYNEFDLVVDPDGFLVFTRNTKKLNHEYIELILEENRRLMTVEEIFEEMKIKYPDVETTESSVRGSLIKEKEKFFYIGRTSTYGLKKWEYEDETLKGGTIRDIAEEFLRQFDEPQHIYDITKYVSKYRDTNEKNIISNFKLEGDNKRFILYAGGFVGLIDKYYPPEKLNFSMVKGFHFTTDRINNFKGRNIEDLIKEYSRKYGYKRSQILSIIESRQVSGEIHLDEKQNIK